MTDFNHLAPFKVIQMSAMSYLCVFWTNSATDSGVNWPPIPVDSGHPRTGVCEAG